jgi:hypothetical protein
MKGSSNVLREHRKLAVFLILLASVVLVGLALTSEAMSAPLNTPAVNHVQSSTVLEPHDSPSMHAYSTQCAKAGDQNGLMAIDFYNSPSGDNEADVTLTGPNTNQYDVLVWRGVPGDTVTIPYNEYSAGVYTFNVNWKTAGISEILPPVTVDQCAPVKVCNNGPATTPVTGLAPSHSNGKVNGYWKVSADGGVSSYGGAVFHNSMGGCPLNAPMIGMADTPTGGGYWLVAQDGGIFSFGDAAFYGSMGGKPLNKPVIAMAATSDNKGYWLVASDGGIFSFGDAAFYGSTGAMTLNQPIVGMAATPDGHGYWLVASDGGIFAFGDAAFYGSMGGKPLNQPVVGMVASSDGHGYLLVAADGGVFAFGDAPFYGSSGGNPPSTPVIGVVNNNGVGYWLITSGGQTLSFGNAPNYG